MTPAEAAMKIVAPLSVLALLAWAGGGARAARAEEPPPPKETRFFESYDKDLDGKVTLEEFQAGGGEGAAFALLDGNKDGTICPDELGLPADYKPLPVEKRPRGPGGMPGGEKGGPGAGKGQGGAGGPGGRGGEFRRKFQEMDADGDGKVSQAEWKGPPEGFARLDKNADGVLDAGDMRGPGGPGGPGGGMGLELVKRRWAEMDADGDGKLTPAEWKGEQPFERVDADKDGVLTEADLKAMLEAFGRGGTGGAGKGQDGAPGNPGEAGGPGKAGKGPGADGPDMLRRFDHDRDGRVTREQFPGSDERFAALDKNGDGVLTLDDFPAPPVAPPAAPAQGAPAGPGLIARLDKDGDGRLSRAEFQGSDDDWRRLDVNTDGWITTDEAAPR
jgi:Ca2+-binding EF-hand superfamily protein